MRFVILPVMVTALFGAACSTPRLGGNPNLTVVEGGQLPPPTRVDLTSPARAYVLGPFDKLSIDVFGIAELSRTVQVDAAGQISLPLIGALNVAGKTPAEVADTVRQNLSARYVRNPQVAVNLVETVSQTLTVDGQVEQPGAYPVIGRMTLIRAIARAKGTTEFASLSHVVVFRDVEGQHLAALYDLRAIRQGLYDDPEVFSNDVIVVGESQARRLFRDIIQGSGLLTAPIIAVLQRTP